MNVTPQAAESATNHDDPGRADLAQKDPLVQPNNARPRNTLQQRPSTGHTSRKRRQPAPHVQRTPKRWRPAVAAHGVRHE